MISKDLDLVFKGLNCAAKVNLAFGFVLKNVEDLSCRYFNAHENNTVLERSKLVCKPDDITNLKDNLQKKDIVDLCTRERANTKWKFYKLANLTSFAALLKDVPIGCKVSVLPEPLLTNQNVNCLTFEKITRKPYNDNLCLFRAVALPLFGNERLEEETSKILNLFLNNCGEGDPLKFQGVHMTDIPKVEEILQLNFSLYDFDFVDGELIGELARRSIQKFEKSIKLLRHNIFVTSGTWILSSNIFAAAHVTKSYQKLEIWSDIGLHVASKSSTFIQRMYTSYEKPSLKTWILSKLHTETKKIKSCLKTWLFLISNLIALRRKR